MEWQYDKRVLDRNIAKGIITAKDAEKRMKGFRTWWISSRPTRRTTPRKRPNSGSSEAWRRRTRATRSATVGRSRPTAPSARPRPRGRRAARRRSSAPRADRGPVVGRPRSSESTPPRPSAPPAFPEVDFATFVLSLASSALIHMGAVEQEPGQDEPDLPLARQTIDIIGMLQQKTKGNLTGEEERLVDNVLYDLRLQFVAASRSR